MSLVHRVRFLVPAACVLAALTVGASVAGGASRTPAAAVRAASFCSVSRDVAKALVRATKGLSAASLPTQLETKYTLIVHAEPKLLGAAPGSLKRDLRKVFSFVNLVYAKLKSANWQIAGLASSIGVLEAKAKQAEPAVTRLGHYYRTTCRFHV